MELPESICNLTNLQFLILTGCNQMTHIPQGIVRLVNLRTLDCEGTKLESFPYGIGRLKHLNELRGFVLNTGNGTCPLEELVSLQELRYLTIDKLERCMEAESIRDTSGLIGNQKLKHLRFHSSATPTSDGHTEEQIERFVKVLDVALHPPSSVVTLSLRNFFSPRYPSWMASASISSLLPNIIRLQLILCDRWPLLPPLGKLPSLEFLFVAGASAVTTIGSEFFGCEAAAAATGHERERNSKRPSSSSPPPPSLFPRLKQLNLGIMTNMEVWDWVAEGFAMRRLEELVLRFWPKLKALPEGLIRQSTCLTTLDLRNMCALKSISGFHSVKELRISGDSDLEIVADLPALKLLKLGSVSHCQKHLPEWLAACPALQRLEIFRTTQLVVRCLQNGADWPMIEHFPIFSIRDDRGNYINYIKHSCTFDTNLVDDDATATATEEEEETEEDEDINDL
ncbi:NB-ARC domain [Musa troglodytarum]|uniref:NB-ARC domain n=1 Tax=Musa troglodytarum TaxID=320322 RepID=A0A9E7JD12_9LILI|nr:NB-ARC domain [Musa troglodytarum]